jgi:hypothetical protein
MTTTAQEVILVATKMKTFPTILRAIAPVLTQVFDAKPP